MTKSFTSEEELHKLMVRAIERDELSSLVEDTANIAELSLLDSDVQFPQFAIDHLTRNAAIESGAKVLESLNLLTLLTSDNNVSISSGEVLRPDLVCINPEHESVVLFELKKTSQAGRQALTELLAYEQEIKNLLPLLSNYDFNFVLVSPEWSPLMDHAVSAAIAWSNRKILCLTPSKVGRKLRLETHVPSAWKITGSVYFPAEAMPCVTVCLYEKDAYAPKPEKPQQGQQHEEEVDYDALDPRIWTALEIIAREGDRLGGHGFALLWKDHSGLGLTKYNLTVCSVSPFAFFQASRMRGNIGDQDGWLVRKLVQFMRDHDPAGHSESLMATAMSANAILNELVDPRIEGFSNWEADRHTLRQRAEPILCEFWGVLGDYARSYVMNPAVRTHRRGTLLNGLGDWRDPRVGIPLIQSFTRPEIFFEGEVRCSDAFRLGLLFGLDRTYRLNIRAHDHVELRCRFQWNRFELMTAIEEVRLLADAAQNVAPPEEPLHFYDDPLVDDDEDNARAMSWILTDFFQKSPIHSLFFGIGLQGCLLFDERKQGLWGEPTPPEWLDGIERDLRSATGLVLSRYKQLEAEGGLWGELPAQFNLLRQMLNLRKRFAMARVGEIEPAVLLAAWDVCLEASDHVIETVSHQHAPVAASTIDWGWLQQGVAEMRARGEYDAGVMLLPNGQIVTGRVIPTGCNIPLKIDSPNEQVPFVDRSFGFGFMRIVTWAELISGEAFERSAKDDVNEHGPDQPET